MDSNLLIAKNRRRQNKIELENGRLIIENEQMLSLNLVQKKKKRDLAQSDSSEDDFLALLHRPKEKKKPKSSINAMALKTEKRDSSEERSAKKRSKKRRKKNSESTIKVEDVHQNAPTPVLQDEQPKAEPRVVDLAMKEEFQRIEYNISRDRKISERAKKKKKGKKSPGVPSPIDVDGEARRPVKDEPVNGREMASSQEDIIKKREERKQEQLKKNNSRLECLRNERGKSKFKCLFSNTFKETLTQSLNEIDKKLAELKAQREEHLKAIESKNEHIEKLENFNAVLHQNGYNTPFKKEARRRSPPKEHLKQRIQAISISSDEEKAPIWERKFYQKKR